MSDANYTLTVVNEGTDEARQMFVRLTGTLSTTRNVICPAVSKLYFVSNETSGGQSIVFKTPSGSGITVPNGARVMLHCNGTNVVNAVSLLVANVTGSVTGNVTGNLTGDVTGNASTATALQTARTINGVSFNGTANITVADATKLPLAGGTMTGAITFAAGQTWPTFNQSTTGNAATATALQTARTINGVSFNGTSNITVTANTTNSLSAGNGLTGSAFNGGAAQTFALGTPSTLTTSTTNTASGSTHTHAVTFPVTSVNGMTGDVTVTAAPTPTPNALTMNNGGAGAASGTTFDGSAARTISYNTIGAPSTTGANASGTWGIAITGNAGTATTLQTARTINGTSFNGSANITTANWGTSRSITIGSTARSVDGSGNVSWSLSDIGAAASNATVNLTGNQTIAGTKTFSDAPVVPGVNGGQLAGMRNKIINGKMEFAQRGTTFAAAGNVYTLDRWVLGYITSAVVTVSQQTDAPSSGEFQNSLRIAVTTADTSISSGDAFLVSQSIEGYNVSDLRGRTFTISFWVRSSKTGVHCVRLLNSGSNRSYVAEYSISSANTWEYKTITVTGGLITSGTWDWGTGVGVSVGWVLACGSNFQTTAGAWQTGTFAATSNQVNCLDTVGNIFAITGVQLEGGSVATPFEHRSIGVEQNLCRRYTIVCSSQIPATTAQNIRTLDMRTTPSISGGGAGFNSTGTDQNTLIAFQTTAGLQTLTLSAEL
jgi:hypothetical protein